MVENDTLTYHVRRSSQNQAKTVDQSLITQERNRKLDLLLHLLANLAQSLVVCGPEGIGKTTLLKVLQERKVNSWHYCLVQGHTDLSFEKIQEHISGVMNREKPKQGGIGQEESRNKKIILMIDDAGSLVPGLITALIQYAEANPLLRVVFVLTHDDLYVKNTTDSAIEDCHFVEIPPLSEKQCGDFLHHLAAKPAASIAFNSINDSLIEKIYRESHGIPGKIIAELPELADPKKSRNPTTILVSAVVVLVMITLGVQWYSASNNPDMKKPAAVKADHQSSGIAPAQPPLKLTPAIKSELLLLSEQFGQEKNNPKLFPGPQQESKTDLEQAKTVDDADKIPDHAKLAMADNGGSNPENKQHPDSVKELVSENKKPIELPAASAKTETVQQQQVTETENDDVFAEEAGEGAVMGKDGVSWIMTQPPENFTLQIMALTKEQGIRDFFKKHHNLGPALTYIKKVSPNGKEKFLLLYGSFADSESANRARESLPPEFRSSFVRKLSSIKTEAGSFH